MSDRQVESWLFAHPGQRRSLADVGAELYACGFIVSYSTLYRAMKRLLARGCAIKYGNRKSARWTWGINSEKRMQNGGI